MKSSVIECSTDTMLDLQCMPIDVLLDSDYFGTVPLIAIRPVSKAFLLDEESLHNSFEEAISGRAESISRQLDRLSTSGYLPATSNILLSNNLSFLSRLGRFWRMQQRAITLACLAFSLLMLGFDLMGLLVLSRP